jgi:hypothetical protein
VAFVNEKREVYKLSIKENTSLHKLKEGIRELFITACSKDDKHIKISYKECRYSITAREPIVQISNSPYFYCFILLTV